MMKWYEQASEQASSPLTDGFSDVTRNDPKAKRIS